MKIKDCIKANSTNIKWLSISATIMMEGSIAVQFDASEDGVVLCLEKYGDGGGLESNEKIYPDIALKDILSILQKDDISSIVKDEDEETYRFEDENDADGCYEYTISCGNDDDIYFSLSGYDFECKSFRSIINSLVSNFEEVKEFDNFINGDYFEDDEDEED